MDNLSLLEQFFRCDHPVESQRLLYQLVWDQAYPIVTHIVRHKLEVEVEDVIHDILVDLISRLRDLKAEDQPDTIRDFPAYVAVTAYHGCDEYFRRRFPQRQRLKNKLRYLLGKDARFSLWTDPSGEWYCGRVPDSDKPKVETFRQTRTREAAALLSSIFAECAAPLLFDDLVDRMAVRWGVSDRHLSLDREVADPRASPVETMEQKAWLRRLWAEIGELPIRQRICLLLNLRDHQGGAAIALLPVTSVAGIREIAATLEMEASELAGLWRDLPLDDATIAVRLGVTRQQVINLRKSARERLSRKLMGI